MVYGWGPIQGASLECHQLSLCSPSPFTHSNPEKGPSLSSHTKDHGWAAPSQQIMLVNIIDLLSKAWDDSRLGLLLSYLILMTSPQREYYR